MILRDMSTNNFLIQRKNTNMVHIGVQSLFYLMNVYVKKLKSLKEFKVTKTLCVAENSCPKLSKPAHTQEGLMFTYPACRLGIQLLE